MATQKISPTDRAEITRLEEAMWRQDTRYDKAFQEARFAQDFFEFADQAVCMRAIKLSSRKANLSMPSCLCQICKYAH